MLGNDIGGVRTWSYSCRVYESADTRHESTMMDLQLAFVHASNDCTSRRMEKLGLTVILSRRGQ